LSFPRGCCLGWPHPVLQKVRSYFKRHRTGGFRHH
tara:strand:+ start:106394 stop:106498 length:105 start_codon:yes stop_codon:yes gene_type:complete